ncbi:MAG: coiled-coil domain-containing protein [Leptospirales bacterium]
MEAVLFDTHGYVKRLESAGIPPSHAEALLEAMRGGLVTKADLLEVKSDLKQDISTVRAEIRELETRIKEDSHGLDQKIETVRTEIKELETRLTLRFGPMLAAGVGLVVTLEKLVK